MALHCTAILSNCACMMHSPHGRQLEGSTTHTALKQPRQASLHHECLEKGIHSHPAACRVRQPRPGRASDRWWPTAGAQRSTRGIARWTIQRLQMRQGHWER